LKAIATNSWADRLHHPCEIIGETRTRYRVRLLEEALLPGGRRGKTGDVVLVPKYAVPDHHSHPRRRSRWAFKARSHCILCLCFFGLTDQRPKVPKNFWFIEPLDRWKQSPRT